MASYWNMAASDQYPRNIATSMGFDPVSTRPVSQQLRMRSAVSPSTTYIDNLDDFTQSSMTYDDPIIDQYVVIRTFAESAGSPRSDKKQHPRVAEIISRCHYLADKNGLDKRTLKDTFKMELDAEREFDRHVRIQERIDAVRAIEHARLEQSMNIMNSYGNIPYSSEKPMQTPPGYCKVHNCVHHAPTTPYNHHRVSEWPPLITEESPWEGVTSTFETPPRPPTARSSAHNQGQDHGQGQRIRLQPSDEEIRRERHRTTNLKPSSRIATPRPGNFIDPMAVPNSDDEMEMDSYYHRAINLQMKGELYRPDGPPPPLSFIKP